MTDAGSCYRSKAFAKAGRDLGLPAPRLQYILPRRPPSYRRISC